MIKKECDKCKKKYNHLIIHKSIFYCRNCLRKENIPPSFSIPIKDKTAITKRVSFGLTAQESEFYNKRIKQFWKPHVYVKELILSDMNTENGRNI